MIQDFMRYFYYRKNTGLDKKSPVNKFSMKNVTDATELPSIEDLVKKMKARDGEFKHVVIDLNNLEKTDMDSVPDEIKRVINAIKNLKKQDKFDGLTHKEIDKMINEEMNKILGKPIESKDYKSGNHSVMQRVWSKEKGKETIELLQQQISDAIGNEDYELAAKLRDKILQRQNTENQKNKKKPKK